MRADLLALTVDDLVVLGNRGIVKRAQTELESGQFTYEIDEANDQVKVRWSDDVVCTIPAGKRLTDGLCTCPATTLCRHLVRSVLAYQLAAEAPGVIETPPTVEATEDTLPRAEGEEHRSADEAPATAPEQSHWDPGAISDDELARHLRKTDISRARAEFDAGQVIEVTRGVKPTAFFHNQACTLRFMVPHDLRYTHCECAAPNPCVHAAEAVWAFRLLAAERASGTISTRQQALPVPEELLGELDASLAELAADGVANLPPAFPDRLRRLEARCVSEGLVWSAEIVTELIQQIESYRGHDARFDPRRVCELSAELCIRGDAIRSQTGAVPQLFIRGSASDRVTDVGSARLVGLGCGVRVRRGSVEVSSYLQDVGSGLVVAVTQEVPEPPDGASGPPPEFWQLAARPALKGVSLAALGSGQLLLQGGKRTPGCRLLPGRARFSFTPQSFQWESLRAPVLVEDFAELGVRLAAAPPASLRPRRLGADLCVLAVSSVTSAQFSEVDQTFYAVLGDPSCNEAMLACPYSGRANEGMDTLIARVLAAPSRVRFVAGHVRRAGSMLVINPISVVMEEAGGRVMLQPWVDRLGAKVAAETGAPRADADSDADPVAAFPDELFSALGEQWLLGLRRADAASWRELQNRGAALGFDRLIRPVARLTEALAQQASSVQWSASAAAAAMLEIGVLVHLARETAGA
ncbi:MAG: hypothetical protein ACO1SX_12895 [Actinomycetota bacterium]